MSPKSRFAYMKTPPAPAPEPEPALEGAQVGKDAAPSTPQEADLQTVARGAGRMQQHREQLNVRLPVALKRQVAARAALEGVTVGELLESVLLDYLNRPPSR